MLMLLCAVATWAGPTDLPQITTDLDNPIYYTIVNTRSSQPGGYMYFAGANVGIKDEQVATITDKHMFYFTGSHDELYVHNAAAPGLKLATIGDGNKAAGSWTAAGAAWAVGVSPKGTGLAFGPKGGLNGNSCWNECNYATNADKPDFTTWSANDDGSIFLVALAEDCEININDFYTIEAPLFEQVQGVKKGLVVNEDGSLGWNTIDLTNKNHYWVPTTVNGQTVALKNLGTEKYLNGTEVSADYVASTVKALGLGQYNIVSNGTTVHANNHGSGANASGNIVSWSTGVNNASAWQFVKQQDPDAVKAIAITYNFTYNGQVLEGYTQTVNTVTGTEYPNITVSFPFGVSATKPEGTIAKEDAPAKTVTIAVEENLPFEPAKDFESIAKWYYMKNKGAFYLGHVDNQNYIALGDAQKTVDANNKDAYSWAFVGDPFVGYQIVNKATGNSKVLSSTTSISNDAQTWPVMTATPVPDGNNELWVLTASSHQTNGFFIAQKDHGSNRMNNRDNKLAYWTGGADNGSTFTVEERDMTGVSELLAYIEAVDVERPVGTDVGYYTQESVNTFKAALAAAKAEAENEGKTAESVLAVQTALQNAVNGLVINLPKENTFYVLYNPIRKTYAYSKSDNKLYHASSVAGHSSTVWKFEKNSDGTYKLYNVNNGQYINELVWQNSSLLGDVAVSFAISAQNIENYVFIKTVDHGYEMHAQGADNGELVRYNTNATNNASSWVIKEFDGTLSHTLTVGDAGYATLMLGYNTTIPTIDGEDCGVFTAAIDGEWAVMSEVEGVLPANTAVIVKAAAGDYTFDYTAETATVENNDLRGTLYNKNMTEDAYVLGKDENNVAYLGKVVYNVNTNTENDDPEVTYEAWKNNANKAYLPAPANAEGIKSYSLRFPGTTGIDGVEVENEVKAIYDLTGRRVEVAERGIYIVGGKKVLVK